MVKRAKLEIIRDILSIIHENRNSIKKTPLLRKANLSTTRFGEYYRDLIRKGFIFEQKLPKDGISVLLSKKGEKFLERYKTIVSFIEEFDL